MGLPGDIVRAHKEAKAKKVTALNDQGLAAYERRDWVTAEADFEKALKLAPKDQVIIGNLAAAKGKIADAQREQEQRLAAEQAKKADNLAQAQREQAQRQKQMADEERAAQERPLADQRAAQGKIAIAQQNKIAVDHIQQDTQDFAQSLRAAPSSGGLEFTDGSPGTPVGVPVPNTGAVPSNSAKDQLLNSGKETTGQLFDNGRAHDDAVVDATLPNVDTPSAQGTPLDARLAKDKNYQTAAIELTKARTIADTLNKKMADLQDQQKASPTPQRQIEISNLSAQTNQANGAVVTAIIRVDIAKKKVIDGPAIIMDDSTPVPAPSALVPESK